MCAPVCEQLSAVGKSIAEDLRDPQQGSGQALAAVVAAELNLTDTGRYVSGKVILRLRD